jgi:beta-glucosidase
VADGSLSACVLAVSSDEGGVVTLRLDDPLTGDVAGAVSVPPTATRHDFVEVSTPLAGAAGVRDLYVVYESEGVTVSALGFCP